MNIKRLNVPCDIKALEEDKDFFFIEGYASTFGNVDLDDDIIERGAFAETIAAFNRDGGQMPLLWQHQMKEPVGPILELREDEKGLYFKAKMPKSDTLVTGRIMPQLKAGSVSRLSIGFSIVRHEYDKDTEIRHIKNVILWEISLVTLPANPQAVITGLKSVTAFGDLAMADSVKDYDPTESLLRVKALSNESVTKACLWREDEEVDCEVKLMFADVVDGELVAVPEGIFKAAALVHGSRHHGMSADEVKASKAHIICYYEKMGLTSPYAEGGAFRVDDLKTFNTLDKATKEQLFRNGIKFSRGKAKAFAALMEKMVDALGEQKNDKPKANDAVTELLAKIEEAKTALS